MPRLTNDPLLAIAHVLLLIAMGIFVVAGAAVLIGIPVAAFNYSAIVTEVSEAGAGPSVFWAILVVLAVVGGVLALAFLFVRHLKRIVESVGEGDPFVPENARRLTAMAWLMLAIQLLAIPVAATGFWIGSQFDEGHRAFDFGMDFNGLILVLTLFILARVFREGAAMRADLEGTV